MKKRITLLIVLSAFVTALVACGGKGSSDTKDKKSAKAAGSAKVTLVTVKDAKMGYTIDIPKGSKTLAKGDMGHTYSKVLSGGMHEYNIHINPLGAPNLATFVRMVTMMGGKKVEQKKAIAGGFLVVKAPRMTIQQVWVTKKGKTGKATAKCSGPQDSKDLLIKICTSLKITK